MIAIQLPKLKKFSQYISGLTLLAFFALVFVGMFDCNNPVMQSQMSPEGRSHTMENCAVGKNCGMDINQHLAIWQGMFTANPSVDLLNFLINLFLVSFVIGSGALIFSLSVSSNISRYLYYDRDNRENRLYNYLVGIFAQGILQPKIFA